MQKMTSITNFFCSVTTELVKFRHFSANFFDIIITAVVNEFRVIT